MGVRPLSAGVGIVAAALLATGFIFTPGPSAPLSPAETAVGLHRLTFSPDPVRLDQVHLIAVETWTPAGQARPEVQRDAVSFYHAVPIEIQQTEDDHPLNAGARADQNRLAAQVEHLVDRVLNANHGDAGRLLNFDGEVWTLDRFQGRFVWTGERGPLAHGEPTLVLHFTPAAHVHSHSRLGKLLSHMAGEIEADAASGQILGGNFHSLGPVKYGAGLLADVSFFDGSFTMQPITTSAGECWVMRQALVRVRSRELFRHHNGVETITYTPAPATAR